MESWTPDDLHSLLDQGEKVFLKLYKRGCGICKLSVPATDRLEQNNNFQLRFGKILIDDHPEMLEIAETEALPVFFIFADQKKKGEYHGFKGFKQLEDFVRESMTEEK